MDWVVEYFDDFNVCIVEFNEDFLFYFFGYILGVVEVDWMCDLNDQVCCDYFDCDGFVVLVQCFGLSVDIIVVFYGDCNNWWVVYVFWVFQFFGYINVKVMDGGWFKWEKEGCELMCDVLIFEVQFFLVLECDDILQCVFCDDVFVYVEVQGKFVDVCLFEEFFGECLYMFDYLNEGVLCGGYILGVKSIFWSCVVNFDDGIFLLVDDLCIIYQIENGFEGEDDVVVYCCIGECSSYIWFVLCYLFGFGQVCNYDGSWIEWGNLVGVLIECQ